MQVAEYFKGNPPHRFLAYPGKKNFTQLGEQGVGKAQGAIQAKQGDWQRQRARLGGQFVNDALEAEGNGYRGYFGQNETSQRGDYPPTVVPEVRRKSGQGPAEADFVRNGKRGGRGAGASAHGIQ